MELLKLRNPIEINGKKVKELRHDAQQITVEMFAAAEARKLKTAPQTKGAAMAFEMDYAFHLYLGMMAIIAVNPEIDVADLERVSGPDIIALTRIGRTFILGTVADNSADETSDEPLETTPERSTPQSETLNKNA